MNNDVRKKLLFLSLAAEFKAWDESKHPRAPKGTSKGGEFVDTDYINNEAKKNEMSVGQAEQQSFQNKSSMYLTLQKRAMAKGGYPIRVTQRAFMYIKDNKYKEIDVKDFNEHGFSNPKDFNYNI